MVLRQPQWLQRLVPTESPGRETRRGLRVKVLCINPCVDQTSDPLGLWWRKKLSPPLLARRKAWGLEDNQSNKPREIGGIHSRPSCSATLHRFMVVVSRALAIQSALHCFAGGTDQCGFLVKATLKTGEPRGALIEPSSFPVRVTELPKRVCLRPRHWKWVGSQGVPGVPSDVDLVQVGGKSEDAGGPLWAWVQCRSPGPLPSGPMHRTGCMGKTARDRPASVGAARLWPWLGHELCGSLARDRAPTQ